MKHIVLSISLLLALLTCSGQTYSYTATHHSLNRGNWITIDNPFMVTHKTTLTPIGNKSIQITLDRPQGLLLFSISMDMPTQSTNHMTDDGHRYTRLRQQTKLQDHRHDPSTRKVGYMMGGVNAWAIIDNYGEGLIIINLQWNNGNGKEIMHAWQCTR